MIDFGINREEGQLWKEERHLLYSTVRRLKPKVCVETGTWHGGGSTYFIASALKDNADDWGRPGILWSFEIDIGAWQEATANFKRKWPELMGYVVLFFGAAPMHAYIVKEPIDFIFLDSGDEHTVMEDYQALSPKLRTGGFLLVHDWFDKKSSLVQPMLQDEEKWHLTIHGTGSGSFEAGSVGIAVAQKLDRP